MCGFIGAVSLASDRQSIAYNRLEAELLGSRGPDESYEFGDFNSLIRFYRLGLIGTDRGLSELRFPRPVSYSLLNGALHDLADRYAVETDHEALAKHFVKHGTGGLASLVGAFALCIKTDEALYLATDRFGEKSLYWARQKQTLYFCTSALLLAFLLRRPPRTGLAVFTHLVLRGLPVGESYFEGIQCLSPGQLLTISQGTIQQSTWHGLADTQENQEGQTNPILSDTRMRMHDGRCAIALSGGFDSSALTIFGYQHANLRCAISLSDQAASTFTDDLTHARQVAKGLPDLTFHEVEIAAATQVYRDFPVLDQDEFGLGTIAKKAKAIGSQVLVVGDGADEMFCGYDRIFQFARQYSAISRQALFERYAYTSVKWLETFLPEQQADLWQRQLLNYFFKSSQHTSLLRGLRLWFMRHHLFWLLRKADFACGQHGIDSRAPYLTPNLWRYATNLDDVALLPLLDANNESDYHRAVKGPLKDLMSKSDATFPNDILMRAKQPFPIAVNQATKHYQQTLSSASPVPAPQGIPPSLHDALLQTPPDQDTHLRYLAYLSWKETCPIETI